MYRRTVIGYGLGLSGTLAGCVAPFAPRTDSASRTRTADSPLPPPPGDVPFGYTHVRADGNRLVGGRGSVPETTPVDVSLDDAPEWVVGVPHDGGVLLGIVTSAGARAVSVAAGAVTRVGLDLEAPPGPPLLVGGDDPQFAPAFGSPTTHPVPTTGGWASVTADGVVRLPGGTNADVSALPDARIVRAAGRLYVLASRTRTYPHGVLGDDLEAGSVAVLDPSGGVEAEHATAGVVEGIAPIVVDVDGDGEREIVVTVSDADRGARIVALSVAGEPTTGPAIGSGFRWRHQVAVAPFGPDGETEIAAVRTPHIGGTAEFYRAREDQLAVVATVDGYSTHTIGSRNLDGGVAGDFDGDGRVELLVPDDSRRALAALRRVAGGVEESWRVPLGGQLVTNLCAVSGAEGVVVAAGRADALRVWPP